MTLSGKSAVKKGADRPHRAETRHPLAEVLTGASRAAVQRNLDWMEVRGLIREVTGQGRYRMWRVR
jgi:Fe2+ or Zn2+ uptake regulation protein